MQIKPVKKVGVQENKIFTDKTIEGLSEKKSLILSRLNAKEKRRVLRNNLEAKSNKVKFERKRIINPKNNPFKQKKTIIINRN